MMEIGLNPIGYGILMVGNLLHSLIAIYGFILFIYILLNLLIQFGIIKNTYKPLFGNISLHRIMGGLYRWYEPPMQAIRRKLPVVIGGLDLSPLALFLLINLAGYTVLWLFSKLAFLVG